jgi:N-acetyl-gamma-glutamyl-phosphate reductase
MLVPPDEADLSAVDVAFTCLPHAQAMPTVQRIRAAGVRALDLSADFRLRDVATYERWYKTPHVATDLLPEVVYGLTEVYRDRIVDASLVACPGCYPTGALLALYPLAKDGHLNAVQGSTRVIVDAKSGVSGAGRKAAVPYLFAELSENFKPYSIGRAHRHMSEMEQELTAWGVPDVRVTFSPHLLPVARGILSTIYVTLDAPSEASSQAPSQTPWSVERLVAHYGRVYEGEPFVRVLPAGQLASLAHAVRTNSCVISFAEVGEGEFIIVSAIDNLIKGASGQAVQNMNLMYGLDETLGLPA